jgi:hypothetical protein
MVLSNSMVESPYWRVKFPFPNAAFGKMRWSGTRIRK